MLALCIIYWAAIFCFLLHVRPIFGDRIILNWSSEQTPWLRVQFYFTLISKAADSDLAFIFSSPLKETLFLSKLMLVHYIDNGRLVGWSSASSLLTLSLFHLTAHTALGVWVCVCVCVCIEPIGPRCANTAWPKIVGFCMEERAV